MRAIAASQLGRHRAFVADQRTGWCAHGHATQSLILTFGYLYWDLSCAGID